jgi:hypothetical protein
VVKTGETGLRIFISSTEHILNAARISISPTGMGPYPQNPAVNTGEGKRKAGGKTAPVREPERTPSTTKIKGAVCIIE